MNPETAPASKALTIWRFLDGKPGHEKQTLGICAALARLTRAEVVEFPVRGGLGMFWRWLNGTFPEGDAAPPPDLLLGAGHATHMALLAARRAHGGRAVLLMRPSLPTRCFDLCLIPAHDAPPARDNVLVTQGAPNPLTAGAADAARGLILIGGPSAHFDWDDQAVAEQARRVAGGCADVEWTLTTSRRTPATFMAALGRPAGLTILPWQETAPGWLEQTLATHGQVWVTPDSVSMVYEALTAGCHVGVLQLQAKPDSRVARGMAALIDAGYVTPLRRWSPGARLQAPPRRLDEAGRAARAILERWFPDAL